MSINIDDEENVDWLHPKIRDEVYIIDLCDKVLGVSAKRQHRFDFLRGSKGHRLPVDAYYEDRKLVIEYREKQHSEPVAIFDKRMTCSGVTRGEQRRQYDELRRRVFQDRGIQLVELDYSMFDNHRKRLIRDTAKDEVVIRQKLSTFLP